MAHISAKKHGIGPFQRKGLSNASKTLLANIRFASLEEEVKTITVVSSNPNEGKTTVVTNLACAIAASGKKVLIVDTDMRRKSIGKMLGLKPQFGLYAVLSGEAKLSEAICKTEYPDLYFMDTESHIANPSDILATRRFTALVEALRNRFDYVIFDTPPLGTFVDGAILSHVTDGTVYAVRAHVTRRQDVDAGLNQLRAADARVLGIVLTFTDREESDYYYYYYYAYYNEEGKRVRRSHGSGDATADTLGEEAEEPSQVAHLTADFASDDIDEWGEMAGVETAGGNSRSAGMAKARRGSHTHQR